MTVRQRDRDSFSRLSKCPHRLRLRPRHLHSNQWPLWKNKSRCLSSSEPALFPGTQRQRDSDPLFQVIPLFFSVLGLSILIFHQEEMKRQYREIGKDVYLFTLIVAIIFTVYRVF